MATNDDVGSPRVDLGDGDALRPGDTIEHADFGPITATRIVADQFGTTAHFAVETAGDGLAVSLTAEQLRDGWGETVARDPFAMAEDGDSA